MKLRVLKNNRYELSGTLEEQARFKGELSKQIWIYNLQFPRF